MVRIVVATIAVAMLCHQAAAQQGVQSPAQAQSQCSEQQREQLQKQINEERVENGEDPITLQSCGVPQS